MHIKREIFDEEVSICKKQFKKSKSCAWGKCDECGVVPLLVKLHEGKTIEDKSEVDEYKKRILI